MGYPAGVATSVDTYQELEKAVLHLPHPDRPRLVTRLLESLDEDDGIEVSDEWRTELQRRVKDIDDGRATMIPHEEVMASARAMIEEVRRGK